MERYIVEKVDTNGNLCYLSSLSNDGYTFSGNILNCLLVTDNEKALIRSIAKRMHDRNPKFTKVKKSCLLTSGVSNLLSPYEQTFFKDEDIIERMNNTGLVGKMCVEYSMSDDINGVMEYSDMSKRVADKLITEYNLKKKENYPW